MPSENQQALRLRLDYFMRRLSLLTAASLTFAAIPYSVKADTGSIEQSNAQEFSLKEDVIFKCISMVKLKGQAFLIQLVLDH